MPAPTVLCAAHRMATGRYGLLGFFKEQQDISLEVSPGGSYLLGTGHIPTVGLGVPPLEPAKWRS